MLFIILVIISWRLAVLIHWMRKLGPILSLGSRIQSAKWLEMPRWTPICRMLSCCYLDTWFSSPKSGCQIPSCLSITSGLCYDLSSSSRDKIAGYQLSQAWENGRAMFQSQAIPKPSTILSTSHHVCSEPTRYVRVWSAEVDYIHFLTSYSLTSSRVLRFELGFDHHEVARHFNFLIKVEFGKLDFERQEV